MGKTVGMVVPLGSSFGMVISTELPLPHHVILPSQLDAQDIGELNYNQFYLYFLQKSVGGRTGCPFFT